MKFKDLKNSLLQYLRRVKEDAIALFCILAGVYIYALAILGIMDGGAEKAIFYSFLLILLFPVGLESIITGIQLLYYNHTEEMDLDEYSDIYVAYSVDEHMNIKVFEWSTDLENLKRIGDSYMNNELIKNQKDNKSEDKNKYFIQKVELRVKGYDENEFFIKL